MHESSKDDSIYLHDDFFESIRQNGFLDKHEVIIKEAAGARVTLGLNP